MSGGYNGGSVYGGNSYGMPRSFGPQMSMGNDNFSTNPQAPTYNGPSMSQGSDNFGMPQMQPTNQGQPQVATGGGGFAPSMDLSMGKPMGLQNSDNVAAYGMIQQPRMMQDQGPNTGFQPNQGVVNMNRITPQQAGPAYMGGGSNWQDRPIGPMRQGGPIPQGWTADPNANGNPYWQSILNSRGPWTYNRG